MKILVVDDTEANRKLLAWILEDEGHEVVEAVNGQEALDLFKQDIPDMVLMDVMMPVMDGFEATAAIKEYLGDNHVPIIFLTALSDDASLAKCLAIGGDDFLSKPINEQVLQAKIKAHARIKDLNVQINRQKEELQKLHDYTLREQEIARAVFDRAMAASLQDCNNTRHYVSPAATFNGDLLLSAPSPSGGLYVLLADFTGHGLPAAIGALPVSQIFYDTTSLGASVSDIARQINRALEKFLPDYMFAATAILELNSDGTRVSLWSGGLPDILITGPGGQIKQKLVSRHMPLGVLEDNEFERDIDIYQLDEGDKVYLYTDGIPECMNPKGEMYGEARMDALFNGTKSDPFTRLIYDLKTFSGPGAQNDDITLIEINCIPVDMPAAESQPNEEKPSRPWHISMELQADDLRSGSPISQLIDMMGEAPGIAPHKDYLHTILSELFSNALEHGVLGLSSDLKETEDGYLVYYQQREAKLNALTEACIKISLRCSLEADGINKLHIRFNDSGTGFDLNSIRKSDDDDAFGRGVSLIETLCDEVTYSEQGTQVDAVYTLGRLSF